MKKGLLKKRTFRAALTILLFSLAGLTKTNAQFPGTINGLFSVSDNTQVYFSQGNLQFQGSTKTWRFAENQWDYIGAANCNISATYSGWIDLFGWATSGWRSSTYSYNTIYQPWATYQPFNYDASYGPASNDLTGIYANADWGVYNAITNGGNHAGQWRTLTREEWYYVFNTRFTFSGLRFAKAIVNGVCGVILFPDDWSYYSPNNPNCANSEDSSYSDNYIPLNIWTAFQERGAVFLPAAGERTGTTVNSAGILGHYWSVSNRIASGSNNTGYAYDLYFSGSGLSASNTTYRYFGMSVRLVRSAESVSYLIQTNSSPLNGGTVEGGGTFAEGASCTLTATPASDYTFVNWTEDGEVVSDEAVYSFTVTGDRTLVANFQRSFTNHWIPESAAYSDNMALNGVIQIDGVEQYSGMLEVGAFCGDECRGSAIATLFDLTQRYIITMTVYGETGHQLTFKLFDHSIEEELNLMSPAEVVFDVNGYGSPVSPYILNFTSVIQTQTTPLVSGWNWYSTYIEQNGIDGLAMLENSLGTNGLRIQGRTSYVEQFEYQGAYYWYGTLNNLANEQMYKVRTAAACDAVMEGYLASVRPITINNGWNWIGYPLNQNVSVADALSGFTPEADDMIKGRNGYATYIVYGNTTMWYGTLNSLESGRGYMYKSNSATSKMLTFQTGRGEAAVENNTSENNYYTPNDGEFANNMVVTAIIDIDGEELRSEDYELAAFVGYECRGSVKLMYVEPLDRYVAFLMVYSDETEDINFALTNGIETRWSVDKLVYSSDAIVGTLSSPKTIHFGVLGVDYNEAVYAVVYPNPSNDVFNIKCEDMTKIEVFNAFGQAVLSIDSRTNSQQIDLSSYASGTYMLCIITDNGIVMKKLFKK